jgi:hypothetical protein
MWLPAALITRRSWAAWSRAVSRAASAAARCLRKRRGNAASQLRALERSASRSVSGSPNWACTDLGCTQPHNRHRLAPCEPTG